MLPTGAAYPYWWPLRVTHIYPRGIGNSKKKRKRHRRVASAGSDFFLEMRLGVVVLAYDAYPRNREKQEEVARQRHTLIFAAKGCLLLCFAYPPK